MHLRLITFFLLCFCLATSTQAQSASQKILPEQLPFELGTGQVPDRETFERLSYQGRMSRDDYLTGIEFIKFVVEIVPPATERMYWINTENIQAHPKFMEQVGIDGGRGGRGGRRRGLFGFGESAPPPQPSAPTGSLAMRGAISYLPEATAPDGSQGLYIFDFQPQDRFSFEQIAISYRQIINTMPFVKGKLAYHLFPDAAVVYDAEREKYEQAGLVVYRDGELFGESTFLALNTATSFGRLRFLTADGLPGVRDIVIARTLPNELPRVAGVITAVRQTPLSHVNLRAVQDKIPNAFVANILESEEAQALMGEYVRLEVSPQNYTLRAATLAEVEEYFSALRPEQAPALPRDLTQTKILPLDKANFGAASSVGVKAANLAVLNTLGLPSGTVPEGFAVPFYFYDQFMQHNNFYAEIETLLADQALLGDHLALESALKKIRKRIIGGEMPEWMLDSLAQIQSNFPAGTSLRCRSSTNNEDLPGFSGAGLYDSYTHHPDEGHLSKSIKQVYASLWNFRAFEEREFYRIDHGQVAMGVLIHPNFSDELANGVAVTEDVLYGSKENYYVNTQRGEELVTNPDAFSAPEEILLASREGDGFSVVRPATDNLPVLSESHMNNLRTYLSLIQENFATLYAVEEGERFAMEIEFKITVDNRLVIKQARPWVF